MPGSPKAMLDAILRNLPARTGRSIEEWASLVKRKAPKERKARIAWLKATHALGGPTASVIVDWTAGGREGLFAYADGGALEDALYRDRPALRPLRDALVRMAKTLGRDVSMQPCKTYLPLSRSRQFAVIKPTTRTRIDLGLALPGVAPAGRLEAVRPGAVGGERMTHRIAIASRADVDATVEKWLRKAYRLA